MLSEKIHLKMEMNNIVSIDFEETVVHKMNLRGLPIEYKVMDMLNMQGIQDQSIDYVIDKGSLDALCSDN